MDTAIKKRPFSYIPLAARLQLLKKIKPNIKMPLRMTVVRSLLTAHPSMAGFKEQVQVNRPVF